MHNGARVEVADGFCKIISLRNTPSAGIRSLISITLLELSGCPIHDPMMTLELVCGTGGYDFDAGKWHIRK